MSLKLKSITNSPVSSVCHIFYDDQEKRCFVVDPGSENTTLIETFIDEYCPIVDYIILTHEHFDHVWGCNALLSKYDCTILCSQYCSEALPDPKLNLSAFNDTYKAFGVRTDKVIVVGDINNTINWQGIDLHFWDAQGHSKGGLMMQIGVFIVTGDTLIKGLKTVTKLKTASKEKLLESLDLLESMRGQHLIVCGGHGDLFDLDDYDLSIAIKK